MRLEARHDALLDAVENVELLSLRWGDVDASLSPEDLEVLAEAACGGDPEVAEQAVDALVSARLLFTTHDASGPRYRSRFAELTRLLARSRQTYIGESWKGSPPLVADFRIDARPRRYPRRDLSRVAASETLDLTALQKRLFAALAPEALAGFQVRAARLLQTAPERDRAVIVTAGTGSGKTLAFYLPAFLAIAEDVRADAFWTKAIAIYPRNELLKDQLTEAYRTAGRCSDALREGGRRDLRIGTFYGDTPRRASAEGLPRSWGERPTGRACPFLKCECGGELVWTKADLAAKVERLTCAECGRPTDERLVLTRDSALRRPPDILFTTTEMLNQSLSDQRRRALFGIARPRDKRPRFLLLDEAHTYSGTSGAQAALTLRRWRALAEGPLSWVGLSATLEEAPRFFADLTGVDRSRVNEVRPEADEIVLEGREYQIALRGDPGSRASLLSTTIQAAMLIGRTLDPEGGPSDGRFGRRTFAFTDDLDVTHRLFHDLRDAEAYDRFGKPDRAREPLATMRARTLPLMPESEAERRRRDEAGQRWAMQEEIGRPLSRRLRVGKTTSGDPGVDGGADLIVATSALEVGFNDATVGAVLQHKAPLSYASFLQRRGRAGRDRRMRPLTVTVLSDYGRDRAAFQSFEHLFDPRLEPQHLPTGNQYILRMQAAFALLDWIATRPLPEGVRAGSVWAAASGPADPRYADPDWNAHVRRMLGQVVRGESPAVASLGRHLRTALAIDDATVDRLLWEPPRSILLDVAPTLARRMLTDWRLASPTRERTHDAFTPHRPLPEAAPRTLFSDLNLPEVEVVLPPDFKGGEEVREGLPVQQALSLLAPGRVTRRFADAYGGLAHWSPLDAGVDQVRLRVEDYAERLEHLGVFNGTSAGVEVTRVVYRPWTIRLEKAAAAVVRPTSNASMRWGSGFVADGVPIGILPPSRTAWRGLVAGARLYLQAYGASVNVRRFAFGAIAEIRRPAGVEQTVDVEFTDEHGRAAGLGYEMETDGLSLALTLPQGCELAARRLDPALEKGVRAALLRHASHGDRDLPRDLNVFQRAWLRQIHLLSVAQRALARGGTLQDAAVSLAAEGGLVEHDRVMDALLGMQRADVEDGAAGEPAETADADDRGEARRATPKHDRLERLKDTLRQKLGLVAVRERLDVLLLQSQQVEGTARADFLRKTVEATLAQTLLAAAATLAPRHAASDTLVVDVQAPDDETGEVEVWLTETTVGGAGVLAALAETVAREPRTLFRAMEAALEPGELEQAATSLVRCFRLVGRDAAVAEALRVVRAEPGHAGRGAARTRFLGVLEARGVQTGRAFAVSLAARMLAPGLGPEHDALVNALLDHWDRCEDRLAFEFEPREVAVLAADDGAVRHAATAAGLFTAATPVNERAAALAALLWPRSRVMGRDALASYNPFRPATASDPLLVRSLLLEADVPAVDLAAAGWTQAVADRLAEDGMARVDAPLERGDLLRAAIVRLPATPVAVGHLKLHPSLERIARDDHRLSATFVLKEQL